MAWSDPGAAAPAARPDGPRILIVDDDPATRRLYQWILAEEGYQSLQAEDGRAALALLAQQPFDLVITDLHMPQMDGVELIRTIRREQRARTIMVITADGTADTEQLVLRSGADLYLTKPFDITDLLRRLGRILGDRPTTG
jgi:two-component system, chemotaxis family, chemotaxis protein CheY